MQAVSQITPTSKAPLSDEDKAKLERMRKRGAQIRRSQGPARATWKESSDHPFYQKVKSLSRSKRRDSLVEKKSQIHKIKLLLVKGCDLDKKSKNDSELKEGIKKITRQLKARPTVPARDFQAVKGKEAQLAYKKASSAARGGNRKAKKQIKQMDQQRSTDPVLYPVSAKPKRPLTDLKKAEK
jgi:hypothetical protein